MSRHPFEPSDYAMNEEIALRVMGWTKQFNDYTGEFCGFFCDADGEHRSYPIPDFSGDNHEAITVIERLNKQPNHAVLVAASEGIYSVTLIMGHGLPNERTYATGVSDEFPLAVCRAALASTISEIAS